VFVKLIETERRDGTEIDFLTGTGINREMGISWCEWGGMGVVVSFRPASNGKPSVVNTRIEHCPDSGNVRQLSNYYNEVHCVHRAPAAIHRPTYVY